MLRHFWAIIGALFSGPLIGPVDRAFWVVLRRLWSRWSDAVVIVKPETVVGWYRAGFAVY